MEHTGNSGIDEEGEDKKSIVEGSAEVLRVMSLKSD